MKQLINTNSIVTFRVQTCLLVFSVLLHVAAALVTASHPLLGSLLSTLEAIGWLSIALTWGFALIKGIQYGAPKLRRMLWTCVCTRVHITSDPFVSVEDLEQLRNAVQYLGLALRGMTPEMEQARRTHYQMRGEALPELMVSPHYATLYAEFSRFVRFLNHAGFPHLESVRLRRQECAFAWQWERDLEARLQQTRQQCVYQQQLMAWLLGVALQTAASLGTAYPHVQQDAGYQQIQGALKLLETMACNRHFPSEQLRCYLAAVQQDLEALRKHLEQAAA